MISTALVPLDGSAIAEAAIPYALALLPEGGHILLLRVLPKIEPLLTELVWTLDSSPEDVADAGADAARRELQQVVTRFGDAHRTWRTEVAFGDPAAQILETIAKEQIDIVAMTTHGRGATSRAIFGGVADRVARTSPVPVLLVRQPPEGQEAPAVSLQRLLVPLDGSALAEAALPIATAIAQRLRLPILLLRVINSAALLAPVADGGFWVERRAPEVFEETTETMYRSAREYLTSIAARLEADGVPATPVVLDASPYFAIAEATEPGDLIVMTSHGRGGALRWFLGSVAEKLVRTAPVPVLLVPSAGRGAQAGTD